MNAKKIRIDKTPKLIISGAELFTAVKSHWGQKNDWNSNWYLLRKKNLLLQFIHETERQQELRTLSSFYSVFCDTFRVFVDFKLCLMTGRVLKCLSFFQLMNERKCISRYCGNSTKEHSHHLSNFLLVYCNLLLCIRNFYWC